MAGTATHGGFGSFRHLAVRFFGALDPRGPQPAEEAWARGWLGAGEADLWGRMSGPDRRHAAGVARDTATLLGGEADRDVMAAALLHDVGKVESGLGTFARVAVTVAAIGAGRDRLVAAGQDRPGLRGRVSQYLEHDRIGADLCTAAGSAELTVAWAREHHLPADRWSVPAVVGQALKEADGD
jgi:hypothetical protein